MVCFRCVNCVEMCEVISIQVLNNHATPGGTEESRPLRNRVQGGPESSQVLRVHDPISSYHKTILLTAVKLKARMNKATGSA